MSADLSTEPAAHNGANASRVTDVDDSKQQNVNPNPNQPQNQPQNERRRIDEFLPDFYNQSNTMMANKHENGDLMLMHNSRIFYFAPTNNNNNSNFKDAKTDLTEHIIGLFVHCKHAISNMLT